MNPIAIDLGFFQINWYSVFIAAGVLIAFLLIGIESKRLNVNKDFMTNLVFWSIIFGIVGARLYYCAFNYDYYSVNPGEIIKIWEGGLAIHGGILFGLLFAFLYTFKYKIKFFKVTDILAVGLIVAQAIGRWGNFFNGEAHGIETTKEALQKLWFIPEFVINGMNIEGVFYHPTFYYESLWCIIGLIVLILIRHLSKYLKTGQLTGIYFMWYSVGRFFIEGLRTDSLMFSGLRVAQIVSVILFAVGLLMLILKGRGSKFENMYNEEELDEIRF
jgi:phosphatidylglycerol:prolipoprotein diacylglycerol transferase